MKIALLSMAAALALSTATLAYAGPQTAASATGESVKINAPGKYHLPAQDFDDYVGAYLLDNGEVIHFNRRIGHFYTRLSGGDRMEIYATGRDEFVTGSGAKIAFHDDAMTLVIENYERIAAAGSNLPANTIVMAKR